MKIIFYKTFLHQEKKTQINFLQIELDQILTCLLICAFVLSPSLFSRGAQSFSTASESNLHYGRRSEDQMLSQWLPSTASGLDPQ